MSSYADSLKQRKDDALKDVKSNPTAALKAALKDLPVRDKNVGKKPEKGDKKAKKQYEALLVQARSAAAECVLSVLCAVENAKLENAIKGLDDEERDTLMKYVYRGFSERSEVEEKGVKKQKATYDCNILLKAHEIIIKIAGGNGPIIRTIHTRLEA